MEFYPYEITAEIEALDFGKYHYEVVWLDAALAAALPLDAHPRLRIAGEIGGRFFSGALTPSGGRHYLMVPKAIREAAKLGLGDRITLRFGVDDQDRVDLPAELEEALSEHDDVRDLWAALTAGRQRGIAHRVASAKTPETRRRRVDEVLGHILDGKGPGGR
ncbi:MAG: YdeI/OmpD-associated family protein [Paracoccaceae bacterium]|nr:YdeI/OmpD-associated family protein [Paracoccaceae bacterium]